MGGVLVVLDGRRQGWGDWDMVASAYVRRRRNWDASLEWNRTGTTDRICMDLGRLQLLWAMARGRGPSIATPCIVPGSPFPNDWDRVPLVEPNVLEMYTNDVP